ncbi:MAG: hypothetical protein EA359_05405 [Balneolaceae bacterium]|nr:MAG: hypothetical protein EA359_05405 [Balneolaceae bacterium]
MKTFIQRYTTTVFMVLLVYGMAGAQIGTPIGDPLYGYSQPVASDNLLQTGGFINIHGGGADLVYRPGSRPFYGRVYIGGMMNPEKRIDHARDVIFGGFSLGYERVLNRGSGIYVDSGVISSMREDPQYYFRIGSGVNFTRVNHFNITTGERSDSLHPGIHTDLMFGVSARMTTSTSFFIEAGGRLAWNNDLPDMQWMAGPHISFGVHLFGSRPGQVPRY